MTTTSFGSVAYFYVPVKFKKSYTFAFNASLAALLPPLPATDPPYQPDAPNPSITNATATATATATVTITAHVTAP